jgi:hypothetical protein
MWLEPFVSALATAGAAEDQRRKEQMAGKDFERSERRASRWSRSSISSAQDRFVLIMQMRGLILSIFSRRTSVTKSTI